MSVDRYAVVGHPIAHSRSPFIHALFAEQTGERLRYEAIDVAPQAFDAEVAAFRDAGGRGLNVTVPLKELAHDLAQILSDRACVAGAVNTLTFHADGRIGGDNTDGAGLTRDLVDNLGWPLAGQRVLMLGAGGAARGVLGPLLAKKPGALTIANRTLARGQALAARFADAGVPVTACSFDRMDASGPFDLVINATSASLSGDSIAVPGAALTPDAGAYDMVYGVEDTRFLRTMAELGIARRADGRGMLVEQAAESFFLWRGVRPQTAAVIRRLGELLAEG